MPKRFTYILRCSHNTFYTESKIKIENRVEQNNNVKGQIIHIKQDSLLKFM